MFGEVIERGFDLHLDRHSAQLFGETRVPVIVGPLAGGDDDAGDRMRCFTHQMRHGEFDDTPDAAGAQVIMDDDRPHNPRRVSPSACVGQRVCGEE